MPQVFRIFAAAILIVAISGPVRLAAQEISITQGGVDSLFEELKMVLESANEKEAYGTLADTLEVFVIGVDRKKPIVLQLKANDTDFNSVFHVPVDNMKDFLANIKTLGVKTARRGKDLYAVSDLFDGYLRDTAGHAILAVDRSDVTTKLTPTAKLVANGAKYNFDLVAIIENDPKQQGERRTALQDVRKEILAAVKPLKEESATAFELREMSIKHQLDELERFYAEAQQIVLGWTTDEKAKTAQLDIDLVGIPATDLAKSIMQVSAEPGYFSAMTVDETSVVSGVVNFPLDAMRQVYLEELIKKSRPLTASHIAKSADLDDSGKAQALAITEALYNLSDEVVKLGLIDGFVDSKAEGEAHIATGGIKAKGAVAVAGLEKLKEAGGTVEINKMQEGDFQIHSLTLPKGLPDLDLLFGADAPMLVATSEDVVFYAVGADAETRLKAAIQKVKDAEKPETAGPALAFHAKMLPIMEVINSRRNRLKTGDAAVRKMAIDAFKLGKDTMDFRLERVDQKVKLFFSMDEGLLRFAGKYMGKMIKDTL